MKKTIVIIIIVFLTSAITFGGFKYYKSNKSEIRSENRNILPENENLVTWNDLVWEGPDYSDADLQALINREINAYDGRNMLIYDIHSYANFAHPIYIYYDNLYGDRTTANFINKIVCFSSRDNNRLLRTYKRFRPLIFKTLDQKNFKKLELKKFLDILQLSYNAYAPQNTLNGEALEKMFHDLSRIYINYTEMTDLLRKYQISFDQTNDRDLFYWGFSFWPRRYKEGNHNAAKIILDDLRRHYILNQPDENVRFALQPENDQPRDEAGNYLFRHVVNDNEIHTWQFDSEYKRTGEWKIDYPESKSYLVWHMKNDALHGLSEYYADGILKRSESYKNGLIDGPSYSGSYADFKSFSSSKEGKQHGEYIMKTHDDIVLKEYFYEEGKKHGEQRDYYENGCLKEKAVYNKGELVTSKEYDKQMLITDGSQRLSPDYTEDAAKELFENYNYLVLTAGEEENIWRLIPVTVKVEFGESECTGDEIAFVKAYGKENQEISYTALILRPDKYNKNEIFFSTKNQDVLLMPYLEKKFTFKNIEYTLTATADTTKDESLDKSSNYKLFLQRGNKTQLLFEIEQLESTIPVIQFLGDIDGDGLPDLIIEKGYNYEFHDMVLYLSSFAKSGELVGEAANETEWRDC